MMRPSILLLAAAALWAAPADKVLLRDGWSIRPSAEVREPVSGISSPAFADTREWYPASVPSTVLSALVRDHVYPDPYFGMNLRSIPGTTYPIGFNFSNAPMPPESPFRGSWWYRTRFEVPAAWRGKTIWLGFDAINFRANVWVNGKQIAASKDAAGAWRLFRFDISAAAKPAEANALAVEIFPPQPHDLAITFVDWNPLPADKDMGLWRDVWISATGPVALRFPAVLTKLNPPANDAAALTVKVDAVNATERTIAGVLRGNIEGQAFEQRVEIPARLTKTLRVPVKIDHPKLWWPTEVGEQNLYPLDLRFEVDGAVSDSVSLQFGIREITSQVDDKGHRLFRINGRPILIRGAGYSFDMLLRSTPERQEDELRYVRDMHLNAVRFEGKLEDDHFLDLCDRYGILVLAGWCCCDHWEHWGEWDAEDERIAAESLRDQLRRMESHPSLADWMYGSDNPPPPKIEKMYLDIIRETDWPNPYHSSATAKKTQYGGDTGVKMTGPYEYVAPSYWYLDTTRGGAHGFNTETSPGPAPPPVESMRRMLPPEHLWPIDSWWDFHAGGGAFKDIHVFSDALDARYGKPASLEDFARKAQVMAYESHRAMFEAYGRNKYTSTGVVQWMLNDAWPGLIWHLYDWYLRPGGSYFGAKKANEPLHVQYSYDDRSIVVVNSYYRAAPGLRVSARIYNLDMTEKFSREAPLDAGEDSSTRVFTLPDITGLSSTYFLRLELRNPAGGIVSRNAYWLSTATETLDWEKSTWYVTPTKTYADYTALNGLPPVNLEATAATTDRGDERVTTVSISNPSHELAFAVHLAVRKAADGEEVLPVLWDDNYFALFPGERREIQATYHARDLGRAAPVVEVNGWNVTQFQAGGKAKP
jgi:exo-1,4-beta-D-glucosaminidase